MPVSTKKAVVKDKPRDPQGRVCLQCGRVVRVNDVYCPACGSLLDGKRPAGQVPPTANTDVSGDAPVSGTIVSDITHSRLVAGLLAFFLGALGIHNFYLGNYTRAVCQLVLTLIVGPLTCFTAVGVVWIWAFIEGALILSGASGFDTDARGIPLRD